MFQTVSPSNRPDETGQANILPAAKTPPRAKNKRPETFVSRMARHEKHPLGDLFGLIKFGVNLTRLAPSAQSALMHAHTRHPLALPGNSA